MTVSLQAQTIYSMYMSLAHARSLGVFRPPIARLRVQQLMRQLEPIAKAYEEDKQLLVDEYVKRDAEDNPLFWSRTRGDIARLVDGKPCVFVESGAGRDAVEVPIDDLDYYITEQASFAAALAPVAREVAQLTIEELDESFLESADEDAFGRLEAVGMDQPLMYLFDLSLAPTHETSDESSKE